MVPLAPLARLILRPLAAPMLTLLIVAACYGQGGPSFSITSFVSGSTTTLNAGTLTQTVTAHNSGATASFGAFFTSGGSGFSIQPSTGTLNANSSMPLTITFAANGTPPGNYNGSFTIQSGDGSTSASGTASETVNGILIAEQNSLTLNLSGTQPQNQTLTVIEAAGFSIPVVAKYSGQSGPVVTVTSPSNTPDLVNIQAAIGTLATGASAMGALTLTCGSGTPCSDTPLNIPVVINATPPAMNTSVLPHFAVGASFVSDFYVVNSSNAAAKFSIAFHDDSGSPVTVPFGASGNISTLTGSIPAKGSGFYEAGTPQGTLVGGSALITSDPGITVQALFRRLGSDGSYYEAAVPASSGSKEIQVPFDDTTFSANGSQIYTGLAIANLDAANAANVSCTAKDSGGNVIPSAIPAQMLNPLGHWAGYLFQPLLGLRGTLDCTSNTEIGAIGIRALGANALSSLPIITLPIGNSSAPKVLPHFAAGGSFVSDFYVVNSGNATATFTIAFHDDNGNLEAIPFLGLGSLTELSGSLPPGGSTFYEAGTPQGTLQSGSALITSDPGITVQALFRRLGSDGSYYEAAVPAATGSTQIQIPFDDTTFSADGAQIYTGLAVANLNTSGASNLSCTASDSNGNAIPNAIPAQTLNPLGHWAGYLFTALVGERGTLDCTSNTMIGAVGIRALGANALSSLPVIVITP